MRKYVIIKSSQENLLETSILLPPDKKGGFLFLIFALALAIIQPLSISCYNMHSVSSNAVYNALSDKVKHLYLNIIRPSGSTVAEKLQTILNATYTSSQYEANVSYVCSVEAGGYWYGFCTFTTFAISANYAEGIAICNSVLCRLMYSNGVWTVRQIV